MFYSENLGAFVREDASGNVLAVDYGDAPFEFEEVKGKGPEEVAVQFLEEVLGLTSVSVDKAAPADFTLTDIKNLNGVVTVDFMQFYQGYQVWRNGVGVFLNAETNAILGATLNRDLEIPAGFNVDAASLAAGEAKVDRAYLIQTLALDRNLSRAQMVLPNLELDDVGITVNSIRPVVYRFLEEKRSDEHHHNSSNDGSFLGDVPRLALHPLDASIAEGAMYAANEVMLTVTLEDASLPVRVFIEPNTDTVLYYRVLVAHACGYVYDHDPITLTGDVTLLPGAPLASLNAVRTPRPLPGLTPSSPQALSGQYVYLSDVLAPTIAPPTSLGNFDYNVDTDDFTAVNAYYHSDAVFRMVEEMGFDMNVYFDGTSFPVIVDHRGKCGQVNAKAPGNVTGDGSDGFRYGLVDGTQNVGIADDIRVVLHEFGHAILWDNVHSPNFNFAHSCGDSLAALLCDPDSKAPDRFETFPWLTAVNPGIQRRHDRPIAGGWAWGGPQDDGAYGSEQILSTTLFRAYLALGGASEERCERLFASRYLTYLLIHAVGILTPGTNPNSPEELAAALIKCDLQTVNFEGHPGGAVHKVIRWAFERQGAYQPLGAPTPVYTPGEAPRRDIYINDGRDGQYLFDEDACFSNEIWNRHSPDGGAAHQKPICGVSNYAYLIVRNRGTEEARFVNAYGYHKRDCIHDNCCDVKDLQWPNDFKPMRQQISKSFSVPPGGYVCVGPFEWIPGEDDCMLFTVATKGDNSNLFAVPASEPLPIGHLVPFDNNTAMRCECKKCNCC